MRGARALLFFAAAASACSGDDSDDPPPDSCSVDCDICPGLEPVICRQAGEICETSEDPNCCLGVQLFFANCDEPVVTPVCPGLCDDCEEGPNRQLCEALDRVCGRLPRPTRSECCATVEEQFTACDPEGE